MRIKTPLLTLVVILILGLALTACGSKSTTQVPANTATVAPASGSADGQTLLNGRCTKCHNLDRVTSAKHTTEQWNQIVTKMVNNGAKLTSEEQATLVDYLAKTYKP